MTVARRVFLDANILFSACRAQGAVRLLLEMLERAGHVMVADAFVIEECRRNLGAKGGPQSLAVLDAMLAHVECHPYRPYTGEARWLQWLPDKDQPVLAAAITLGCHVLLTGDKTHFGARYGDALAGVTILSPAMLHDTL